jgi:hypothetical protein
MNSAMCLSAYITVTCCVNLNVQVCRDFEIRIINKRNHYIFRAPEDSILVESSCGHFSSHSIPEMYIYIYIFIYTSISYIYIYIPYIYGSESVPVPDLG